MMGKDISRITPLAVSVLKPSLSLTYPIIPLSLQRRSTQSSIRTRLVIRMK